MNFNTIKSIELNSNEQTYFCKFSIKRYFQGMCSLASVLEAVKCFRKNSCYS